MSKLSKKRRYYRRLYERAALMSDIEAAIRSAAAYLLLARKISAIKQWNFVAHTEEIE